MEPGKAAFILFLSEKYCRVSCSMKSVITSTITEDRAVPSVAFALHPVGEAIIKSFVLSVTRYRHHCACHSCQLQWTESQTPPNTLKQPFLEEATHCRIFIMPFSFWAKDLRKESLKHRMTGLFLKGMPSAGKYLLPHTPSKAVYGPAEMRLAPTLSVRVLRLPPHMVRPHVLFAMIRGKHDYSSFDLSKWRIELT